MLLALLPRLAPIRHLCTMAAAEGFPTPDVINSIRRGKEVRPYDLAEIARYIEVNNTEGQKGEDGRYADAAPTPEEMAGKIILFNNRLCPFGHRAYWSATEKGLFDRPDFDYVHVNLGPLKPEWYKDTINPAGTVPCVYEDGRGVFESSVVVEYAEDRFPTEGTKFMPDDPVQRAAIRAFIGEFSSNYISPFYKALFNKDPEKDEELLATVREKLVALNKRVLKASADGPFVFGDTFTAADINVGPFLYRFQHSLAFYRGYELLPDGDDDTARLRQFLAAISERPAFQRSAPPAEFLLAAYYVGAGGTLPDVKPTGK